MKHLEPLRAVLRGISQVMLLNHALTGALFLLGLCLASLTIGAATALGAAAGTLTARAFGTPKAELEAGLHGFNGALVGVTLVTFFEPRPLIWAVLLFAAASSTVVAVGLTRWLSASKLPALTAPFVLVAWATIAAQTQLTRLSPPPLSALTDSAEASAMSATALGEGLVRGVAQVFLQDNLATGALFILGLLVASRLACGAAIVGSGLGLATALGLGAPEQALRSGLFGYNAALTAIALCLLLPPRRGTFAYAAAASAVSAVITAAAAPLLAPLGLPALTAPFVVVTWLALLAAPGFSRLRAEHAAS